MIQNREKDHCEREGYGQRCIQVDTVSKNNARRVIVEKAERCNCDQKTVCNSSGERLNYYLGIVIFERTTLKKWYGIGSGKHGRCGSWGKKKHLCVRNTVISKRRW